MSTAPSDHLKDFVTRLRRELRADEDRPLTVPDTRRRYREAACLLTHFDPLRLRLPGEDRPTGGAVLQLLDDCTTTGRQEGSLWSLKSEVRDETLRGLAGPDAARRALEHALDAVPDDPGPERICLAFLAGGRAPPSNRDPAELADTLRAVLWLSRVPGTTGLPDAAELRHTLEQARLLQPLERLVQGSFRGRTQELDTLRRYVYGPAPGSGQSPEAAPAGVPETSAPVPETSAPVPETSAPVPEAGPVPVPVPVREQEPRPAPEPPPAAELGPAPALIIRGPGGMGKSTLLAAFLLDSIHGHGTGFPFAYIDFERPTLSIQEPATLIAEMARQLGIQYPAHRAELDALADECRLTVRSQREGEERVTQLHRLATTRSVLGRGSSQHFQTLAAERETGLIRRTIEVVVRAVAEAGQGNAPFLLAVDSFEEAQYRASPVLGRMWAMFAQFQSVYPRLRVVVSGRASVDHPMRFRIPHEIELGELDPGAATGLLAACGVKDAELARVLADRVGGHPLSLKLAARAAVLAEGEADGTGELLRSLPTRRDEFFRRVDQLLVQGILYDRILHHIADHDVRRLAHPGLVLRVITPEIIKDVLAEPCGLRVETPDRARRLFDALSRLDLVEQIGPDAVRHRTDVRAIMLRLPGSDRTEVMRTVERRAVEYYARREGLEARAEEIYHRLRLDESPRAVEERWLPGVERLLSGSQQDMSHRAAALLTAKLGGDAPDHVLAEADQEDWERIAARETEDLLAQGFAEEALVRLGERRPWTPCSPLHPLLAETLSRLGRADEARVTVADAIASSESCPEQRLELLLLSAGLAEDAGDLAGAHRDLRRAEDIAVDLGEDLEAMGALLARSRLTDRAESGDVGSGDAESRDAGSRDAESGDAGSRDAGSRLAQKFRHTPDAVLADQPALVRAVASQVYVRDPGALQHALEVVGLPTDDEALETLGTAIRSAAGRQPALLGSLMGILRDAAGPSRPQRGAGPASTTGILRLARERGTLDTLAQRLLAVPDKSGEIAGAVATAMGAGTGTAGRTAGTSGTDPARQAEQAEQAGNSENSENSGSSGNSGERRTGRSDAPEGDGLVRPGPP
ncbi:ATP-binding protein [Streptomyces sp. NPDC055078]